MSTATFDEPESPEAAAPDSFGRTWSEVAELIELRRKLAEAEIRSDLAASKRFAVLLSFGLVLALTGTPLLLTALAYQLSVATNLGFSAWLAILGGPMLVIGLAGMYYAWQRFRREFLALATTRAELHEDLLWLGEWLSNS